MEKIDYTTVTEITGYNVTSEQLQRMYTRYKFASEFCKNKEVLELGCGSGQGLGYLAGFAKKIVGGDCDEKIVKIANEYYQGRVEVRQLDAHNLPFNDQSFDVIVLYEAIYYLSQPERFINESRRVLRNDGLLIICTANKDWSGFNPSPYSFKYFSANELFELLEQNGFTNITLYGNCQARNNTIKAKIISTIKEAELLSILYLEL
jgi:ubiquinone/menaquinone biosynthesis C-methylase UbiE